MLIANTELRCNFRRIAEPHNNRCATGERSAFSTHYPSIPLDDYSPGIDVQNRGNKKERYHLREPGFGGRSSSTAEWLRAAKVLREAQHSGDRGRSTSRCATRDREGGRPRPPSGCVSQRSCAMRDIPATGDGRPPDVRPMTGRAVVLDRRVVACGEGLSRGATFRRPGTLALPMCAP
jgi:hypothetical protein